MEAKQLKILPPMNGNNRKGNKEEMIPVHAAAEKNTKNVVPCPPSDALAKLPAIRELQ